MSDFVRVVDFGVNEEKGPEKYADLTELRDELGSDPEGTTSSSTSETATSANGTSQIREIRRRIHG